MKLWDYSHLKGNIQGRVAPQISLFWGIGVVFLVKFIQPFIQRVINWEEALTHGWLAVGIVIVMGTDTVLTMVSVHKFHVSTKQWDSRINHHLEELRQRISDAEPAEQKRLRQRLADWRSNITHNEDARKFNQQLSWNHRRLLKSFPKLKVTDAKHFNKVKQELVKKS